MRQCRYQTFVHGDAKLANFCFTDDTPTPGVAAVDFQYVGRGLYDVAWADFHRFLKGWSPGHWKINSYSEQLTRRVIERLRA